jgi:hypothetical protein
MAKFAKEYTFRLSVDRSFMRPACDKKKEQARALMVERLNAALKKSQSK